MDFDTYCRRNDLQAHLQWHPVRNNGLLPSDVPAHSNQKAWWICPKGHEWHAAISQRARGVGCPVCAGKMVWKGENDLATLHPELVGEWHPEKNQDLQPDQVTSRSGRKVWWICEKGHEWQAVIASRSKGHGCPCCAGNQVIPGETDLATMAPQLALEWHPTLNGPLSPGTIAARSSKRIWWQCRDRHVWQAKVSSRFFGNGCPYCSGRRVIPEKTDLATMFPEIAETWCTEMNQDLFPNMVTTGSGRRVWWQCGRGHRWQSAIVNRTQGHGCPYCANQKVQSGENDLASQFPFLAKQWHPVKNEELLPSDVVAGSKRKVWWQCERGHEWQAAIGRRVAGHGCPYCSNQKVQKGENDLASQLPSLAKQWHPVKNKGLLPSDVVVGSQRKVWWLCDKAHEWQAAINSRVRGNGCPYCSGRRAIPGITDLATVDPVLSQQWHPTKNLHLSPVDVPAGSVKKVW